MSIEKVGDETETQHEDQDLAADADDRCLVVGDRQPADDEDHEQARTRQPSAVKSVDERMERSDGRESLLAWARTPASTMLGACVGEQGEMQAARKARRGYRGIGLTGIGGVLAKPWAPK